MEEGMKYIIAQVILIVCQAWSISCADCPPSHPQQSFCESAWAIKGKVLKYIDTPSPIKGEPPLERNYLVRIDKVFKQPDTSHGKGWKKGSRAWIATDGNMGMFGVNLKSKQTYFITGIIYDKRAFTSNCNWIQLWKDLDRCHNAALTSGIYLQNCICVVSTCIDKRGCFPPQADPGCTNYNHQNTYEVCSYDQMWGVCEWSKCGLKGKRHH